MNNELEVQLNESNSLDLTTMVYIGARVVVNWSGSCVDVKPTEGRLDLGSPDDNYTCSD